MVVMRKLMFWGALSAALGAAAESTVSDVLVNQRWPWSEKGDQANHLSLIGQTTE